MSFMPSFLSDDIVVFVPINEQISKSSIWKNWINFKQNSHSKYKQENDVYYLKIYFTKDWIQGASSQTKLNIFKNNWKLEIKINASLKL